MAKWDNLKNGEPTPGPEKSDRNMPAENNAIGIASFIFGTISIIVMAPIFVPLAVIFGIIAIFKKQTTWGVLGLICAFLGFATSPILLGLLALTSIDATEKMVLKELVSQTTTNQAPRVTATNTLTTQQPVIKPQQETTKALEIARSEQAAQLRAEQDRKFAKWREWYKPDPSCQKQHITWEKTVACGNENARKKMEFEALYAQGKI